MSLGIPKIESRVAQVALFLAVCHLAIIAWSATRLGISVPSCLEDDPKTLKPAFERVGEGRYQAKIVASMWRYEPHTIRIPVGSTLDVFLASKDVLHGFYIKDTVTNLMAIPGTVGYAQVCFEKPGRYPVICHEYCGAGHHGMMGMIEVYEGEGEAEALGLPPVMPAPGEGGEPLHPGVMLTMSKGCAGCHSPDGSPLVGPTFKGLAGSERTFADGSTGVADADYLRRSMREPNSQVVKGFQPNLMPPMPLTDEEVETLVEYIQTLK